MRIALCDSVRRREVLKPVLQPRRGPHRFREIRSAHVADRIALPSLQERAVPVYLYQVRHPEQSEATRDKGIGGRREANLSAEASGRPSIGSRRPRHPTRLESKFNDHECPGFSYPQGLAWRHGLEQLVVDRSLRKPNMKITRSPVRDVDKSVEILLQKLARIGFQVTPFVVVREARGGNCCPRGDGT